MKAACSIKGIFNKKPFIFFAFCSVSFQRIYISRLSCPEDCIDTCCVIYLNVTSSWRESLSQQNEFIWQYISHWPICALSKLDQIYFDRTAGHLSAVENMIYVLLGVEF